MFRKCLFGAAFVLPMLVFHAASASEALPPRAEWIPKEVVFAVDVTDPSMVFDRLFDPKVINLVNNLPMYKQQKATPGFEQMQNAVKFLEASLGTDWQNGLRKLFGGGATFAVSPAGEVLLIVDSTDTKMLNRLHEILVTFNQNDNSKKVASKEYHGVMAWTFDGEEAHAIIGNRFILSNKSNALKAVIDRYAKHNVKDSMAKLPAYQAAKKTAGEKSTAFGFVNLAIVNQHPGIRMALEATHNPMASFLLGGINEALHKSTWMSLVLNANQNDTLALRIAVDGKANDPSGMASFAFPTKPDQGALPLLEVPRQVAGVSLYRDVHKFYAAKDDLFPERTSGLIFFENMMGIFFGGRDLTEEVFGEMGPEVRVVVAEQKYDPKIGTPEVRFPSFAIVMRMHDPENFSEVIEEGWQKALGLINFTRGQKAEPGLIIAKPTHHGITFTKSYFSSKREKNKTALDSRYNFQPSLAFVDNYLIVSSAEVLTCDLIDAIKKETSEAVQALAEIHSLVEFDTIELASILRANRKGLIQNSMIEKGNTIEEAKAEFDMLTTILKYFGKTKLEIGSQEGKPWAKIQVKLNLH